MSAFDTSGNQAATPTEPTNQGNYVEQLVKAKGEDWKDPETIAKGKLEADTHIENLERQLAEMREDLGKQEYSKQLLDKLQGQAAPPTSATPEGQPNTSGGSKEDTTLDASELESLIERALTTREATSKAEANVQAVDTKLVELYGTEAGVKVQEKASQVGMSVERLRDLAAESPAAFFNIIGEEGFKQSTNSTTTSTVNTDVGYTKSTERDYAYYAKLRKENKKLYYNPKTQAAMLEDRKRLGDKFGN